MTVRNCSYIPVSYCEPFVTNIKRLDNGETIDPVDFSPQGVVTLNENKVPLGTKLQAVAAIGGYCDVAKSSLGGFLTCSVK